MLDLQQDCIRHFEDRLQVALGKVEWLLTERDSLRCLLARSFQEGQSAAADRQHRELVKMLVGEGWDPDTDKRQFERARAQVLTYIKSVCGKDTLKQQQLCKALYHRYIDPENVTPQSKAAKRAEKVTIVDAAIVAGVRDLLQRLKERSSGGRYTHDDRVLHNALTTAAGWKAGARHCLVSSVIN